MKKQVFLAAIITTVVSIIFLSKNINGRLDTYTFKEIMTATGYLTDNINRYKNEEKTFENVKTDIWMAEMYIDSLNIDGNNLSIQIGDIISNMSVLASESQETFNKEINSCLKSLKMAQLKLILFPGTKARNPDTVTLIVEPDHIPRVSTITTIISNSENVQEIISSVQAGSMVFGEGKRGLGESSKKLQRLNQDGNELTLKIGKIVDDMYALSKKGERKFSKEIEAKLADLVAAQKELLEAYDINIDAYNLLNDVKSLELSLKLGVQGSDWMLKSFKEKSVEYEESVTSLNPADITPAMEEIMILNQEVAILLNNEESLSENQAESFLNSYLELIEKLTKEVYHYFYEN